MNQNSLRINMQTPINILIGENGCGKSTVLSELARYSVSEETRVIAIATSVYDKFPRRNIHKNYHYMGSRLGRFISRDAVKQAIAKIDFMNKRGFSSIYRVLDYVDFEQRIGFCIGGVNKDFHNILHDCDELDDELKTQISIAFKNAITHSHFPSELNHDRVMLWFSSADNQIDGMENSISELLTYERILKKLRLINSIEILLSKGGKSFLLSNASSGELSLISVLVFISTFINEHTMILIDEPENSLHPKWQKEYFKKIMDLFSYFEPQIIAATHSPLIVSGVQQENNVDIHKYTNDGFILDENRNSNAEDIYSDLFDIITPASRSLSNKCADLLNNFSDNKISFTEANEQIKVFLEKSYDIKQKSFLEGIIDLLKQMSLKKKVDVWPN